MASSSSHQGATPSSHFKYDVFLSFRGTTRHEFTDALYHALIKAGICTFRDREDLRKGEKLEGALLKAIERSRMSILVLCEDYPTSRWCLDEVDKIMECSGNGENRPVIPIYFHVEKPDVQFQKNSYKAAMKDQEKGRYWHRVEAWRSALSEVGSMTGYHVKKDTPWGMAIKEIVEDVTRRLPPLPLHIDRSLGLTSELEKAQSLLEINNSHATCFMLGIHGDRDEISKFVAELYNKIRPYFETASFLSNIREKTTARGVGLEDIQETLLSEMGEKVNSKIGSTLKGSSEIKRRLGQKRVLLVLDDVDSIKQLSSLAGGLDWFGPGSRIIVTTRYEYVLDEHVSTNGVVVKKYYITEGSSSTVKEENVVGLEKDFNMVMNQLKDEDSPGNVVSIVGMAGLGKTTLARKVYYSNEARQLFPYRAWVTVSQRPSLIHVLENLLKCLQGPSSTYEESSEDELEEYVRKCLNGKKYLVVLDDVWDTNTWGALRGCFPRNNKGSMILVTTRYHGVANAFESRKPHLTVSPLNEEESWELFRNEVFYSTMCPSELEPIGRSIAESCNGLPLLIKTTAGIVAKREKSEEEWEQIENVLPYWSTAEDKDGKKMMEILKLSYYDLSEEMKPCFLYLGAFPEDEEILVRELICMWMAEDFIKPIIQTGRSKIEAEDIGEQYLKELVDRNLVQVASRRSDGKGVKTVKIHDLIRELCILESNNPDNKSNKACGLVFREDIGSYACLVRPRDQSRTCSLFLYGDDEWWSLPIPQDFQVINVLYLGGEYGGGVLTNAEYLNKFKSIRFFKGQCAGLNGLLNFQGLQTLYAESTLPPQNKEIISIHEGLKQLRHIVCYSEFHLFVDAAGVRDKMQNMQTLLNVHADSQMWFLFYNGYFANLRTLGLVISNDYVVQLVEAYSRSLDRLSELRKLELSFDPSTRVSLGKIAFPSNLTSITLRRFFGFKYEDMNALGRIPELRNLKLVGVFCSENILYCGSTGSFPQLQVFIMDLSKVEHVIMEDGAMPKLRRAVFDKCQGLKFNCLPERMLSLGSNLHVVDLRGE